MSDISESNWSASDVVEAINDHYTQDPNDPDFYRCDRCGHKLYVDFETNEKQIPVPATLFAVSRHERTECPHRDDAV